MTDSELIEQFEHCTLSNECFHHAEHVRVAFLYLSKYALLEALAKFSQGLQRFAAAQGKAHRYHETITWAYVFLIHARMSRAGRAQSWEDFAQSNADLLIWEDGILNRYYHQDTLASELARTTFIFPDRCALASPAAILGTFMRSSGAPFLATPVQLRVLSFIMRNQAPPSLVRG